MQLVLARGITSYLFRFLHYIFCSLPLFLSICLSKMHFCKSVKSLLGEVGESWTETECKLASAPWRLLTRTVITFPFSDTHIQLTHIQCCLISPFRFSRTLFTVLLSREAFYWRMFFFGIQVDFNVFFLCGKTFLLIMMPLIMWSKESRFGSYPKDSGKEKKLQENH